MFFNRRAVPPDMVGRSLFGTTLTNDEKGAFKLHLISQVLGAVAVGVMMNHDYIATNGLGASVMQITL
ncbi:MAG: hypothetical protein U9P42_04330, partial [Candidatus Fermentibacteria bacterium]|nr:hypothetical protein [Candidatus Fermentibacteria bacterium]